MSFRSSGLSLIQVSNYSCAISIHLQLNADVVPKTAGRSSNDLANNKFYNFKSPVLTIHDLCEQKTSERSVQESMDSDTKAASSIG